MSIKEKRLYKSRKNRKIAGVCAGLAEYFNIDPTIVRLAAIILILIKGLGLLLYVIAMIVIPFNPDEELFDDQDVDNFKSANIDDEKDSFTRAEGKQKSSKMHSNEDFNNYFNNK